MGDLGNAIKAAFEALKDPNYKPPEPKPLDLSPEPGPDETGPTPDLDDALPLECLAFHESGHAAVLLARGRRFRYVTIIPNGTVLGECSLVAPPLPDPISPAFRIYLLDRIQSTLAGEIADTLHCGRVITKGVRVGDDDLARAANMAALLTDGAPALVALVEDLMAQTRGLLADPPVWRGVVALATALLQDQQLSYAEAHAFWVSARALDRPNYANGDQVRSQRRVSSPEP